MSVYQTDSSLPKLPIPKLSDTDKNLRDMIRPLVNDQQFMRTKQQLDIFFAANGPASILQTHLYNWRDSFPGNESWLRPIWDDIYLSYRERLPVNMNYGFELDANRWGGVNKALPRFIAALADSIRRIRDESYEPEANKTGPLSMDMMKYMIYTRIPCQVRDVWYHLPLTETPTIAVVCNHNWFLLSLCDESGLPASPESIGNALSEVRQQAEARPGEPVSAFTAAPREEACALRTKLSRHSLNRTNLEGIEKSLFVVCLDSPDELSGRTGADVICGSAANRWFDKSLQIISSGGRIALNFEHSGCDASIWLFVLAAADTMIINNQFREGASALHIRKLNWHLTPMTKEGLEKAREDFRQLSDQVIIDRGVLTALDKETIKSFGCSPDTFVQLLYQAAYLELTGKVGSVYEAVAVRGFYQGRTECQRPLSTESMEFARRLLQNKTGKALKTAFRSAVNKHTERLDTARKALGGERHMTGLAAMHQMHHGGDLPEIFSDEGYCALRHDSLSTSSVTAPFIDYFGFAPVVNDGLGIGYGIRSDGLHLMVSAYPESGLTPTSFLDCVDWFGKQLLKE